jgi:tRNA G10  N-methylase Trm11
MSGQLAFDLPAPTLRPAEKHPARFSPTVLAEIQFHVYGKVLDPFAGTGKIHRLSRCETYGVEIEPEWAIWDPRTIVGDATALPFEDEFFDCIATSPCYGNRFADHHVPGKATQRTYRQDLGRALHPQSAGKLHWDRGPAYREFHVRAWHEAARVLEPEGRFILNISDYICKGRIEPVSEWHLSALRDLGFELRHRTLVPTRRMKHGRNHEARVEGEWVFVLTRGRRP